MAVAFEVHSFNFTITFFYFIPSTIMSISSTNEIDSDGNTWLCQVIRDVYSRSQNIVALGATSR